MEDREDDPEEILADKIIQIIIKNLKYDDNLKRSKEEIVKLLKENGKIL